MFNFTNYNIALRSKHRNNKLQKCHKSMEVKIKKTSIEQNKLSIYSHKHKPIGTKGSKGWIMHSSYTHIWGQTLDLWIQKWKSYVFITESNYVWEIISNT